MKGSTEMLDIDDSCHATCCESVQLRRKQLLRAAACVDSYESVEARGVAPVAMSFLNKERLL